MRSFYFTNVESNNITSAKIQNNGCYFISTTTSVLLTKRIFLELVKLSFSAKKIQTIDALLSAPAGIFNRETPCKPRKSRQRFSAFPLVAAHECASEKSASMRRSALALRRVTDTGGFSENKVLLSVRVRLLACA